MDRRSLPKKAFQAVGRYIRRHPEEVLRSVRNAASLKLGVPLPAIRWLIRELGGEKVPSNLVIEARSAGFFLSAHVDLMKTPLSASAEVLVENVDFTSDAWLVDLRIQNLQLEVLDSTVLTPIAALLRSGALDLSRPGDLISYMPRTSPILVRAEGNRFRLDLLQHPKLADEKIRKIVSAILPLVSVSHVQTADDHLDIAFSPLPQGAREALEQWRKLFST